MNESALSDPALLDRFVPLHALDPDARRRLLRQATILRKRTGESLDGGAGNEALYLLQGEIDIADTRSGDVLRLRADEPLARHRLGRPAQSLRCHSDCCLLSVDADLLDLLLSLALDEDSLQVRNLVAEAGSERDWMAALLSLPSFQRVAPLQLQAMFLRLQPVTAEPGEVVIRERDAGDYFYVIVSGRCTVSQSRGGGALPVAELQAGSCFGEEALLGEQPRNATVTMLSRGRLMRLARQDFLDLLRAPIEARIAGDEAAALVHSGRAAWLDVRSTEEFAHDGLDGAHNLPLAQLRENLAKLDRARRWIVCCDTGRRSSVAVFIAAQQGFDAVLLDGGLAALQPQRR